MDQPATSIPPSGDAPLLPETAAPVHRSKQDQVAAILQEAASQPPAESPPAPETAAPAESPAETPVEDLATLAQRLGKPVEDLYNLKLPMPDGAEPVTLGQLKDAYRAATDLEAKSQELTKARGEWHADQLRQQRELEQLLAAIPRDAIRPELAETVSRVNAERISRETEALLRRVPEWSDPGAVKADMTAITAHLQPYGITAQDLQAVTDHRLLAYFRDQAKLAAKLQTAPAKPAAKPAQPPRRAAGDSPALQAGRLKQAVTLGQMRPVDAVAALLRGN